MTMWLSRSALVLALGSAVAAILAGLGSRMGWWHFRTGFQILTWAAYGGLGSAIIGFIGCLVALWRGQRRGAWLALVGLIVGLVVVGVPWQMKRTAQQVPPIHDITTDTDDPPRFVDILPFKNVLPNAADYGGPDLAAQQHAAYPDIQPVTLRLSTQQTFTQALRAADAMGWDIVAANPEEGRMKLRTPRSGSDSKTILSFESEFEATKAVSMFGQFPRVGKSDLGKNAQRIRAYIRRLIEARSTS